MGFEFLRIKDFDDYKNEYDDKLFLTFDIDWASDEVLNYTIDKIEEYDIAATFFVTHRTAVLDRLRNNPKIELGIHPNFNFLLNGDFRYGKNASEVVDYYFDIVPDAVSVRSHALVQSTLLLDLFYHRGIKYDLNLLIPHSSGIELKPIPFWRKGLIRLPYFWEDDTSIWMNNDSNVQTYLETKGLKIFDFHPIHVFLNTENLTRYDRSKHCSHKIEELRKYVNAGSSGTMLFFENLINKAVL